MNRLFGRFDVHQTRSDSSDLKTFLNGVQFQPRFPKYRGSGFGLWVLRRHSPVYRVGPSWLWFPPAQPAGSQHSPASFGDMQWVGKRQSQLLCFPGNALYPGKEPWWHPSAKQPLSHQKKRQALEGQKPGKFLQSLSKRFPYALCPLSVSVVFVTWCNYQYNLMGLSGEPKKQTCEEGAKNAIHRTTLAETCILARPSMFSQPPDGSHEQRQHRQIR